MCTAMIGMGIQVASTIWGGIAQNRASRAQAAATEAQAQAQADLMRSNAARARTDAERLTEQETNAVRDLVTEQRSVIGGQNAAFGASGTTLSSGDLYNIGLSTGMLAEQDLEATRANYANSRLQYLTEAQQYEWNAQNTLIAGSNQANLLRAQGKSALTGSLLSSAGLVASNWGNLFSSGSGSASTSGGATFTGANNSDLGWSGLNSRTRTGLIF